MALIGGLTSSMLLMLVVVPVIYILIDKAENWFSRGKTTEIIPAMALN